MKKVLTARVPIPIKRFRRKAAAFVENVLDRLYDLVFACGHPDEARSRVWTDPDGKHYQTCFDCGKRLEYSRIQFRNEQAQAAGEGRA